MGETATPGFFATYFTVSILVSLLAMKRQTLAHMSTFLKLDCGDLLEKRCN